MKSLIQFFLLLALFALTLFLLASRLASIEEEKTKNSPYQIYDPFKDDLDKDETAADATAQVSKKEDAEDVDSSLPTASPTQIPVISQEEDLSEITLQVDYIKLPSSISRTSISNLFFSKSEKTCALEDSFSKLISELEKKEVRSLILTIESILPKSEISNSTKSSIAVNALGKDNILNLNLVNNSRPQLFGIYLCSDEKNRGSCAMKEAYGKTAAIEDAVFFFTYAYFDNQNFSLISFPSEKTEKHLEKFARNNFGPSDKSDLIYANSKSLLAQNYKGIKIRPSSSGISLIFSLLDEQACIVAQPSPVVSAMP